MSARLDLNGLCRPVQGVHCWAWAASDVNPDPWEFCNCGARTWASYQPPRPATERFSDVVNGLSIPPSAAAPRC